MNKNIKNNKKTKNNLMDLKPFNLHKTLPNVSFIVQLILEQLNQQIYAIQRNKYLDRMLLKKGFIEYKDFNKMYLSQYQPKTTFLDRLAQDELPKTILIDSLSSYQIDNIKKNSTKKPLLSKSQLNNRSQDSLLSIRSQQKKKQIVKLPLQIIQQKQVINVMRNQKIQEELRQLSLSQSKIIHKIDSQNIGFDYNGEIIKTKTLQRSNLISSIIKQKLNKGRISKKKAIDSQFQRQSTVQGVMNKKYLFKNKNNGGQKIDFQSYQGQPLIQDVEMHKGIRYSHDNLVYQPRLIKIQQKQLKQSLGKKRISRDEFQLIKSMKEKKSQYKNKKIKTEIEHLVRSTRSRAFSEMNLNNRFKRDSINIINAQLRQSLLIKLSDYDPYLRIQRQIQENQHFQTNSTRMQYELSNRAPSIAQNISYYAIESKASSRSKLTNKLPALKIPNKQKQDDLILTKLQHQLKNKLKI